MKVYVVNEFTRATGRTATLEVFSTREKAEFFILNREEKPHKAGLNDFQYLAKGKVFSIYEKELL